jgi:adenosylcobinamide-GDP ribazoletransferase
VVLWLGLLLWPAPVAVLLSMAATAWLTGGLHEDGLADSCDALLGNAPKEQALAIMKDPRIGSYGVLGLVFVLALKAAALYGLALASLSMAAAALVVAHAVSRAMAVLLLARLPYAGDAQNAKARPMTLPAAPGHAMVAIAWAVLALLGGLAWLSPMQIAGAGAAAALVALLIALRLQQRLGGITGDTLGATQQCSELAVLLAVLAAA